MLKIFRSITLAILCITSPVMAANLTDLAPMLEKVTPAIVNIIVKEEDTHTSHHRQTIMVGSGVILDAKQGLIVTNSHVIDHEKVIVVTLKDGERYRAKLIGKDSAFDLAVLKINAKHLTQIQFANSDQLKVGNLVVAIGSPFGLTQTVTSGVISALNRSYPQIQGFQNFIQTDAPINPGNSGGALLNTEGQLVGINTAIVTPDEGNIGIGFAIPSNMVKSVITQLIQYGKVERGMLGVVAQDITPELADALQLKYDEGTIITQVVDGTPAKKVGLQSQDIILEINNVKIHNSAQLHNMLGVMRPNSKITITILRNHKSMTFNTQVGNPKTLLQQRAVPFLAGLRLQDFSELEPDGSTIKGALVVTIEDTSDAALAGLEPGDVILTANEKPIDSVKTLTEIAHEKIPRLLLNVARENGNLFLVIQKDDH